MKRARIFFTGRALFCLAALLVLAGCPALSPFTEPKSAGSGEVVFIAAEWNAQALFDGKDSGGEYREYLEAAGWTKEKYAARLTAFSEAVSGMSETEGFAGAEGEGRGSPPAPAGPPGLIGFAEIENEAVLSDLAGSGLSKLGFFWTAFAKAPGAALGVGFLSRFPIVEAKAHSVTEGNNTAPRPVLEARIEPGGKPLVFLLCHWKSKLGGGATEASRRASARVVRRRLREINAAEAETPVIVMGDLNENHDEFYRASGTVLCALLPDDPGAAALAARRGAGGDYLVVSAEKPPRARSFTEDTPALYSPWHDEQNSGSYRYRGEWETIDHFLLSGGLFDGAGWEFSGFRALQHEPFTASGGPAAYMPRSGRGLSDHLPLLLYLRDLRPEITAGTKKPPR